MNRPTKKEMAERWNLAKNLAERINEALIRGYVVFLHIDRNSSVTDEQVLIDHPVTISKTTIFYEIDDECTFQLFDNDPHRDHGLYQTHEEWVNSLQPKIYRPVATWEFNLDTPTK